MVLVCIVRTCFAICDSQQRSLVCVCRALRFPVLTHCVRTMVQTVLSLQRRAREVAQVWGSTRTQYYYYPDTYIVSCERQGHRQRIRRHRGEKEDGEQRAGRRPPGQRRQKNIRDQIDLSLYGRRGASANDPTSQNRIAAARFWPCLLCGLRFLALWYATYPYFRRGHTYYKRIEREDEAMTQQPAAAAGV